MIRTLLMLYATLATVTYAGDRDAQNSFCTTPLALQQHKQCSSASVQNRPSWGFCSLKDIKRLGASNARELPAYSEEIREFLEEVSTNQAKPLVDDRLAQSISAHADVNKLTEQLDELDRKISEIRKKQSKKHSLKPKKVDNKMLSLREQIANELFEKRNKVGEQVAFTLYSYCTTGNAKACARFEFQVDTHGIFWPNSLLPGYCAITQNPSMKGNDLNPYTARSLALAELLSAKLDGLNEMAIEAYAKHRSIGGYLDSSDASFAKRLSSSAIKTYSKLANGRTDRWMRLSDELLKLYSKTSLENADKRRAIARALMKHTNGHFSYYFSEFFDVATDACVKLNDPSTCVELARSHQFGKNTSENVFMAEKYFEKALKIKPDAPKVIAELAALRLSLGSPVYDANLALESLESCSNSFYCKSELAHLYSSKKYPKSDVPVLERLKRAEKLWTAGIDQYDVNESHSSVDTLLKIYDYHSLLLSDYLPSFHDLFKAALTGHKKAQVILALAHSGKLPNNLVVSRPYAYHWALLAYSNFGQGLSENDKTAMFKMISELETQLSKEELRAVSELASERSSKIRKYSK